MFRSLISRKRRTRAAFHVWFLGLLPITAAAQGQLDGVRPIATVTLTQGAYPEFFEDDTLRWVGNALFNTRLGKVVAVRDKERVYRFGFNGKENDNEVHNATGTSVDFGARMYDPRVGR
jgi:hypothetical protein